nr:heparinase II/III family protein [Breznakibacter sp.]
RKLLKNSESHNGLAVDGQPNSIYNNTWGNSFNAKGMDVFTKFAQGYGYAQCTNNCYQRLTDPVNMTRRVLYLKPGLWLVFDNFVGRGDRRYSQFFGFADKQVEARQQRVQTTYGKNDLVVEAIKPVEISLTESVWSPEYNLLKENVRAEFSVSTSGSHSLITALYFPEHGSINIKQIPVYDRADIKLADTVAEAVEVVCNGKEYVVLVVNNPQGPVTPFYKVKGFVVTGEVVLLEKQGGGYVQHVIL